MEHGGYDELFRRELCLFLDDGGKVHYLVNGISELCGTVKVGRIELVVEVGEHFIDYRNRTLVVVELVGIGEQISVEAVGALL